MQRDSWGKWAMGIALLLIVVAGILMILSINKRQTHLSIGGQVMYARVADNDDSRRKGLSGTPSLGEREAMLFIFDAPSRWGMWMRDMNYNIDIVWLSGEKRVVYMAEDISPDTYPRVFLPNEDALYVVELPAGFIKKYGVGVGHLVGFSVR